MTRYSTVVCYRRAFSRDRWWSDRLQTISPFAKKDTPKPAPAAAPAPAPRSDQDIATDVQYRISGESALNGQNIQVGVNGGTVTLKGTVNNDASRALAAAESGGVNGVRTVINNLTVAPERAMKEQPPKPAPRRKARARQARNGPTAEAMNEPPPPPPPQQRRRRRLPARPPARRRSLAQSRSPRAPPCRFGWRIRSTAAPHRLGNHPWDADSGHHCGQHGRDPSWDAGDRAGDPGKGCHALLGQLSLSIELTQIQLKGHRFRWSPRRSARKARAAARTRR